MIELPAFKNIELLYEGRKCIVYKAFDTIQERNVILKLLHSEQLLNSDTERFRQEYRITSLFDSDYIIKCFNIIPYRNTDIIVYEDIGAESLKTYLSGKRLPIKEFLDISIKIAKGLKVIHSENLIHKDINPSNVIINADESKVKIIDFGISSEYFKEDQIIVNPEVLEGTLNYMAPEQTGRMNRSIDYRADFYSYGVMLYEMLTGSLPFNSTDSLEIVHAHIAKVTKPPHEKRGDAPKQISQIIMKLLEKNAENRYQSADGIIFDLEECRRRLTPDSKIAEFPLATHDYSDKFHVSQKLYGRRHEIEELLDTYKWISAGHCELFLVKGPAGSGKSALVRELFKPITENKGIIVYGKYEKLQRNTPYKAILDAIRNLIDNILVESEEYIKSVKKSIRDELGEDIGLLNRILPEIMIVCEEHSCGEEISEKEMEVKTKYVLGKALKALINKDRSLVIALDDLQWIDFASLQLIHYLLTTTQLNNFMVIGTYRDNEVDEAHPLNKLIDQLKETDLIIHEISLNLLTKRDVICLLEDSFETKGEKVEKLADTVVVKTGGNPFFINEFLLSLYNDKMIEYDFERSEWTWQMYKINQKQYTDNVIELMSNNISSLKDEVQYILKLASVIGSFFSFEMLLSLSENMEENAVFSALKEIIAKGYLSPVSSVKAGANVSMQSTIKTIVSGYKFSHDRIQQSAYSLVDQDLQKKCHKKIALYLLKTFDENKRERVIFDIVNHLNAAGTYVETLPEKKRLAELNYRAAIASKNSAAYSIGLSYIKHSISCLTPESWSNDYENTLKIYKTAADLAMHCAEYDSMNQFAHLVEKNAVSILDEISISEIIINSYIAKNQLDKAIETAFCTLRQLRIYFPKKVSRIGIIARFLKLKILLGKRRISTLENFKSNDDESMQTVMRILSSVSTAFYFSRPDYLPYIAFKMIEISLKYGNSPESAQAYVVYGLLIAAYKNDVDKGFKFGKLALNLVNKKDSFQYRSRVYMIFYAFVDHWKNRSEDGLKYMLEGYNYGLETGDYEFASHSVFIYCSRIFFAGKPLVKTEKIMKQYSSQILKMNQAVAYIYNEIFRSTVKELQNGTLAQKDGSWENNPALDEICSSGKSNKSAYTLLMLNRMYLSYTFGNYNAAEMYYGEVEKNLSSITSSLAMPWFYLYKGLTCAELYLKKNSRIYLIQLKTIIKQMKKWAYFCPENYRFYYLILHAELMRVKKQRISASAYYDKALTYASNNGRANEIALANELSAKFFLQINRVYIAKAFFSNAEKYYNQWQAFEKVKQLHLQYPEMLQSLKSDDSLHGKKNNFSETSSSTKSENLDIRSVMKASLALSEERQTDSLLEKVMVVIMENAAAQKGVLIVEKNNSFYVLAESENKESYKNRIIFENAEETDKVPHSILNYVIRKRSPLIIDDALSSKFSKDDYFNDDSVYSILCLPIIHHDEMVAVLYLENNIMKGVFSERRISVLNMICTQAAVSLQNANYYEQLKEYSKNLESKVRERTSDLENMNKSLIEIYERLSQARIEAEQDMNMAGNVQKSFLPSDYSDKSNWDIAYIFKSMTGVSGDFYDFYEVNDKLKGVGLFDVSGHGISSGLITVLARSIIYHNFSENLDTELGLLLKNINNELSSEISHSGNYLTGVLLRFKGSKIEYVNAGHPSIFRKRSDGEVEVVSKDGEKHEWRGVFLGMPFIQSDYGVVEVDMQSGEFILLYSDCLNESLNKDKIPYGTERIIKSMAGCSFNTAQEILDKVVSDFYDFAGSESLNDDFTVMVIRKK